MVLEGGDRLFEESVGLDKFLEVFLPVALESVHLGNGG